MKHILSTLIAALTLLLITATATAIPARPSKCVKQLADGTRVVVTLCGDEFFNYFVSDDGRYFVSDDNGLLVPMSTQPQPTDTQKRARRRATSIDGMLTNYPTIGSPRTLVLLVEYQDVKFKTANAAVEFDRLMNQPGYDYNGATGSALDYFTVQSSGLFTPKFVVCGPVTLPNKMAYYGAATANASDTAPWEMVSDGCLLLKEQNPDLDFSQFDNDGDGYVDNVFVFYAGYGQNAGAESSTVWPHAANITWYGLNVEIDGVKVDNYACTNEITGNEISGGDRCGIGTFCHEFSHVLGLPDLYATDYSSGFTPGAWELMDIGPYNNNGNTPPNMSAYDRSLCKWLNPREITTAETLTLPAITDNKAYLIKTFVENEYFLLENRQQEGWDKYIPGHGMLVWHIDYDENVWSKNTVNNNPSHQRVDIIEADGLRTVESQSGDPFPGRTGVTELTDYSSPAMSTWTGTLVGCPLTDITEIDGIITFKAKGGGDGLPVPTALDAQSVTPVSLRAVWTGDVSVSTYEVDICLGDEVMPFATLTRTINSLSDCWVDVEGLQPATRYRYCVRSVDGNAKSADSNPVTVTTLPPTFDMLTVTALEATDIDSHGFTARWQPLEGADSYLVDVYTKKYVTPVYDTLDFTGGLSALPDGWTTSSTSTSGVAGTYGESRPSLLLRSDQDYIASPAYDFDINSLSFWHKASSAAEGSLSVEYYAAGVWRKLAEGCPLSTVGETWQGELPSGARRIRLTVSLQSGSVYLDDIAVAYNGAAEPDYVARPEVVGTAEEVAVTDLQAGQTYYYTVRARQGGAYSRESAEIAVSTAGSDGVGECAGMKDADRGPRVVVGKSGALIVAGDERFTLQGQRVR